MSNFKMMKTPMILTGIDAANPLGFLAALGAAVTASVFCKEIKISWQVAEGGRRPALWGTGNDRGAFIEYLDRALQGLSMAPFEIDDKLPFAVELLAESLSSAVKQVEMGDRRMVDFLAAFGSEVNSEKEAFKDTQFRMVRSGDSAGQGLPAYVRRVRLLTNFETLSRTLFKPWDYQDECSGLRLDPIDDKRYALRWRDPSKSGRESMIGANDLAIEALQLYPTAPRNKDVVTTGFSRHARRQLFFSWPIWEVPVSIDTLRSLLALNELYCEHPPRDVLSRRGVVEVYRSQRIQQNQYYSNFTPGRPVA